MLCANVKVSAEIYKKNNAKPPAGIRYTHPRGYVFSFYFKRIITGKAPRRPLGGSWLGSKAAQTEGATPTVCAATPHRHLPQRWRRELPPSRLCRDTSWRHQGEVPPAVLRAQRSCATSSKFFCKQDFLLVSDTNCR